MIGIIDYDAGNIRSVEKAMKYLGQDVCITRDRDTLLRADKVILPGVGSFGDAMNQGQENDTQSGQGHSAGGGLLWRCHGKAGAVWSGGCDS